MMTSAEDHMQRAIAAARAGHTPFGCVIAQNEQPMVTAYNTVRTSHDPTAHAEVVALRQLGQQLGTHRLGGYSLYTTGEPCPMCAAAIAFAGIDHVVFGASIDQISAFLPQIRISAAEVFAQSPVQVRLEGGMCAEACLDLLRDFG